MGDSFRARIERFKARPFPVLAGHFFNRLFQNDVVPFEDQMKQKLYVLLAMLAAFGWLVANSLFGRYMFVADTGESWLEKCQFLSVFMVLMALVTVLEWDVLFLDRRDYANLMPLPIRTGTLFEAKFASLVFFVAVYAAAVNGLSVFGVAFFMPRWIDNSLGTLILYMIVHVVSTTAAFLFVFFLLILIEAALMAVLSARIFRGLSLLVRFLLVVACLFFLLMFTADPGAREGFFSTIAALKTRGSVEVLLFPPMWFTGLYEILLGRSDPLYGAGALMGLGAILVLALAYFLAMNLSYRRHVRRSLEIRTATLPGRRIRSVLASVFNRLVLRDPVQRAVFQFYGKTLKGSVLHKIRLGGYLSVACGLILILLGAQRSVWRNPTTTNVNLLGIPLILGFFLVVGLRNTANVPISKEANWIFRITEDRRRTSYFIGAKKAMAALALLPLFAVVALAFGYAWGPWAGVLHAAYGLACSLILSEILFWKYPKIPFTCATVPGRSRLPMLWWAYVLGFSVGLSVLGALEKALFRAPAGFAWFFGAAAALLILATLDQRLFIYEKLAIVYEEEPEPVMITL
jgi:hypothetical protein